MTPDSITSLVKVREALNKAPSQHTALFSSLTENGNNHPHSCRPSARLAFGPDAGDFPGLGKRLSPFNTTKIPSLEELQGLLIDDLQAARNSGSHDENRFFVLAGDAQIDEQDEDIELLSTLTDGGRSTSGTVLAFPSPSLEDICGDAKVEYDNVLRESITMATVLPAETLLTLQHSNEGTTLTTLLSGSVAWIIWPPTKSNLDILQSSYEAISEGYDGTKMNVCSQLQGGVCLVQSAGEAVRMPPFCPMMCLSLETSVLATYSVVTASQFTNMLGKLPLLLAWHRTEIDGERKKREFVTALISHLSAILQGTFETVELAKCKYPYANAGPLYTLLHGWDDTKHAVASILEQAEAEQVIVSWEEFLRSMKGRECWVCGKRICNKSRDVRRHFESKHWSTEQAAEDGKHNQQPQQKSTHSADTPAATEGTSEDIFHDAVEAIDS